MNKLLGLIEFIKERRKILISIFFSIGLFSAIIEGVLLVQRPQTYRSKAADISANQSGILENMVEFTSPRGFYKLSYDKNYWTQSSLGPRVIFNLNNEYGSARLDIIESESDKDLDSFMDDLIKGSATKPVKIEPVQFKKQPAYLLTYQEQVIGQNVYFNQQIIKIDNHFFIFEKRAPKLTYHQAYLDNLLEAISFSNLQDNQVKGISQSDLTTVELIDLVRPSITNVVYLFCLDILNLEPKLSGLSKSTYQFCAASKGSGFIVNEEGIVSTNGHVVKIYPEEALATNLLNQGGKNFTYDLIKGVYLAKGQIPSSSQIDQFYQDLSVNPQYLDILLTDIFDMIGQKILSVSTSNEKYYANSGSEPIKIDYRKLSEGDYSKGVIPSATTYTANLIGFDYPNKYSYDALVNKKYTRGADVALLRINNSENNLFAALELGSQENLREGSEVIIAGYPTLVEGDEDPRAAISYQTSTKPTFTRGIISSIKQDLTGKEIFQTDASIDHGNSGGPAFNESAQVIGIATFMAESQTGNFNFLRDVMELKELMTKYNIENKIDKVSSLWREGLDNFGNQYYQKAIADFQKVKALSKNHPTADEFIKLSEDSIAKGESLEGLAGLIRGKNSNVLLIVFGGMSGVSFMMAGLLTIIPYFGKKETYY